MFWSKKGKYAYLCTPQFCYYIKVGFKGLYITRTCFRDGILALEPFIEPRHEKTGFFPMRKQRRRSAVQ